MKNAMKEMYKNLKLIWIRFVVIDISLELVFPTILHLEFEIDMDKICYLSLKSHWNLLSQQYYIVKQSWPSTHVIEANIELLLCPFKIQHNLEHTQNTSA